MDQICQGPVAGHRASVQPGLGGGLMGQSGVRNSHELRSSWSSQGKEAMTQVCLGQKHFLFGQGWVGGCSPHPMASSRRFTCVSAVVPQYVDPGPCMSSSVQMGAQVCAKSPRPKEASCRTWLEEVISSDYQRRVLPPTLQQPGGVPTPGDKLPTPGWQKLGQETEQANCLAQPGLWSAGGLGGQQELLSLLGAMIWDWRAGRRGDRGRLQP